MGLFETFFGFCLFCGLCLWGWWRDKNYEPGNPAIIPPVFIMLVGAVGALVFGAHLFGLVTGLEWTPPYMR